MAQGTIKWFDPKKGYGFIKPDDGSKDAFLHISALEKANITQLDIGQAVQYELTEHKGKQTATDIQLVKQMARTKKQVLKYDVKMSKRNKKVRWLVIERPTGSIIAEEVFEDDAMKIAKMQQKTQQWAPNGGVVKHLTLGKIGNEQTK